MEEPRKMELRQLRYIQMVARLGTLTAAASELGIAQPALSQSISRLEAEFGIRLFTRSRKGVTLTKEGQAFLSEMSDGLALIDAAAETLCERAKGNAGRLVIGFVTASAYYVLPRVLRGLREGLPRVEIELKELRNIQQPDALRANEIDIGIVHSPLKLGTRVREKILVEEKLVAVVPDDFPEPEGRDITLADLAPYDFVTFPANDHPSFRNSLDHAFRERGLRWRIGMEVSRSLTALSCVSAGYGVTIVPESISGTRLEGVKNFELNESQFFSRMAMSVIWRSNSQKLLADMAVDILNP